MAILMAGTASAAPGGNGKGQGNANGPDGHGQGLALAKGHEKHAPATPLLSPPPAPASGEDGQEAAEKQPVAEQAGAADAEAPGQATRHHHVTICHATGSGRYIVISPSVVGVERGHFRHHDDFVYNGSCSRGQSPSPDPDPEPPAPPTSGGHPPSDPQGGIAGDVQARPSGTLPFTGLPALAVALFGGALAAAGWALTRRKPV